jgi:hypothetical protein
MTKLVTDLQALCDALDLISTGMVDVEAAVIDPSVVVTDDALAAMLSETLIESAARFGAYAEQFANLAKIVEAKRVSA